MGHVDEAALGADRLDRLVERHPARDLLLEEEADHLALVGGLDLLRHDHLDAELGRLGARVEGAGDLVVVGHRDRAEAGVARAGEQHLDRRRAVARVVGVHVQVDVDQPALGQPRPHRGQVRRDVAARRDLRVDRLEAARHARPVELVARARARARAASRAGRRRGSAARAGRRACRRPRARTAARGPRRGSRPPRRRAGATRPAGRRRRARARAGRARGRPRARRATAMSAPASTSAWVVSCAETHPHAVEQARADRRRRAGGHEHASPATSSSGGSRRSARRNRRSAPRSSWSQKAIGERAVVARRARSAPRRGAGRGSRRGRPAASGRAWPRRTRCARRAGRRTARRSGAPPASRARARRARGRSRR